MDIFKLCIENNINLFRELVPGSENKTADWIFKDLNKDDYVINPDMFAAAYGVPFLTKIRSKNMSPF